MKTYIISLKRAKQRYNYIQKHAEELSLNYKIIDAVDGRELSQKDIENYCDIEAVNKYKNWLTKGAIGCALSHKNVYEEIVKTGDKCAFIIEDDAVLPANINTLLAEIEEKIQEDEIILLYYTSFEPAKINKAGRVSLTEGGLYYPVNVKQMITATAYVIGKMAAKKMAESVLPIRVAADTWSVFLEEGYFSKLRVHFPALVETKNFKSSINYFQKSSVKAKASEFIDEYKIPIIYQLLRYRRKKNLSKMKGNFILVDE